jgi:hypothetical protein
LKEVLDEFVDDELLEEVLETELSDEFVEDELEVIIELIARFYFYTCFPIL